MLAALGKILRSARTVHTATEPAKVTTTAVRKPVIHSQAPPPGTPNWGSIAENLEANFKNNKVSVILKTIPKLKDHITTLTPAACSSEDAKAISKICDLFGYVERTGAQRKEGKAWYKLALLFDKNNAEAREGLRGILAQEGDPSMNVTFYAPNPLKFK